MKCKNCGHGLAGNEIHTFYEFYVRNKKKFSKRVYKQKCRCGCKNPEPEVK